MKTTVRKSIAVLALLFYTCIMGSVMPYRVDVHHHYLPPAYLRGMHTFLVGHTFLAGVFLSE